MREFVSFKAYCQSIFYMSTILLKDNIYGERVPYFQLAYICNTNNTLHINLVKLCSDVHYI